MKAALYIRVSTEDQTEYSPAAQQKALTDYAKKSGMEVLPEYIFVDEGFSGRSADKRPNFMRMIGIAKTKKFDVILVHKFDRFARSREDSIVYKSMLKKQCQIRVISITESLDEEDKMSGLIEAILEAMAEYYSINLSEEVKKGMTEKARQGGFQTSPPLGYTVNSNSQSKGLQIVEKEAEYIRYIFSQYAEYGKGPSQIAKQLNKIGVLSKRGNPIDVRNVEYILQNPIYAGKVRWTPTTKVKRNFNHPDTIIADGSHAPIISCELFRIASEKMSAQKKKGRKGRPLHGYKHWLSGLIECSNCGKTLVSCAAPGYFHFQCRGYNTATCKISHAVSIKLVEKAVVQELACALKYCNSEGFQMNPAYLDTARDGDRHGDINGNEGDELEILQKQLARIDIRIRRATDAYLAEVYSLDEFKKLKANLDKQRTDVIEEIEVIANARPHTTAGVSMDAGDAAGVGTAKKATVTDLKPGVTLMSAIEIIDSNYKISVKQKAVRSIICKIIFSRPEDRIDVYYHDISMT